jgi:protein-disulfide isomerase
MKKTTETKSKAIEPKSNTPILIIGAVLVLAVLGGWYMFSSAKSAGPSNANSNVAKANTAKTPVIPVNAPAGANPPNQSGSPAATVTLEEFADFQCAACAAAHKPLNEIKSMYGSRIRFIFRNFPLAIPAHDKSYDAAVVTEAAGMQGKFFDMQNLLFVNQQAWTASPGYREIWKGYAQKIGLDVPKWESDMAGIAAKSRVDADIARGKGMSVNSTPTLYLNGVSVGAKDMQVDALKALIDAELQKGAPQAAAPTAAANAPAAANQVE